MNIARNKIGSFINPCISLPSRYDAIIRIFAQFNESECQIESSCMKRSSESCNWNNNLQGLKGPNSSDKRSNSLMVGELNTSFEQACILDLHSQ